MIEICNREGFDEFLAQERAILFYAASWSRYATISRQMIEFVEEYAKMGKVDDVPFFIGQFENDPIPLGKSLVAAGVPFWAFDGSGSLSFFVNGTHVRTMRSVIGEGTWAVWTHIHELFGGR